MSASAVRPLRVALIDDDRMTLTFLADVLSSVGYAVQTFRSAEEALAELWDRPVDVAVVDLLLPHMSGAELIRELRRRPWGTTLPVVAISALQWSGEQVESFLSQLAPCRMLEKPVDVDDLVAAMETLLAGAARIPTPLPTARPGAEEPPQTAAVLEVSLLNPREILREYTQNLVRDGLFISTYDPLPKHAPLQVRLRFPFRRESIDVTAHVVGVIRPEDAAARTHGPGMALWLEGLPRDVKRELAAYVAGLRAFAPLLPPARPRTLILAGVSLPPTAAAESFLRRSGLRCITTRTLAEAAAHLRQRGPASVVLDGTVLGAQPLADVLELERAGADWIAVIADAQRSAELGERVELLRQGDPPQALLELLSARLEGTARASARVPLSGAVAGARPDGAVSGTLRNLSLGGMLLTTDSPCAPGDRVEVDFALPEGAGRVRAVATAVRVTRLASERSELSVALSFERVDPDSLDRLRVFLESRAGPSAYQGLLAEAHATVH